MLLQRQGTTYGKMNGILPAEANRGDGEKRESEHVCVYVCVRAGGKITSDKKLK